MNITRFIAIGSLVLTLNLHAQTAGAASSNPAPAPGPTMQQTVDFINQTLTAQGSIDSPGGAGSTLSLTQSFELAAPCSLNVLTTQTLTGAGQGDGKRKTLVRFDLEKSDPLSMVVSQSNANSFGVGLGKTVANRMPPKVTEQQSPQTIPAQYFGEGIIRSVDGKNMTFISEQGEWLMVSLTDVTRVLDTTQQQDGKYVEVSPQSLRLGDSINVVRSETKAVTKKKNDPPAAPQIRLEVVVEAKASNEPRALAVAFLKEQDKADRIAKALIHAIVLCHKPEAPSIF